MFTVHKLGYNVGVLLACYGIFMAVRDFISAKSQNSEDVFVCYIDLFLNQ